jgi:hypothetical protein
VKEAQIGLQKSITWTKKFGNEGKNGNGLALKVACDIKN